MICSYLMGQTGPCLSFAGFGNLAAAVSGFQHLGGLPGRITTGGCGPCTDFISMRYNALAILAALEHKRCSGEDRWVAIGIQTDAHWRVRCDLLEPVEFSEDAELDNLTGRQSGSAEIDASISAWTGSLSLKTQVYWNGFAPAS